MAGYATRSKRLYRSRDGKIFGVCQGIADWRDLPVDMVRLVWILLTVFTSFFPGVLIYFILTLVLPLEPEYRDDYRRSRRKPDVESEFEDLKERVRRMEDEEVDKEKDWEKRFDRD